MKDYKPVKADGVAVVIIWKNKVLLLKRRRIPFIYNPGTWGFVTGSKKNSEGYVETAYREVEEETRIPRKSLTQAAKPVRVWMFDARKQKKWQNYLFFFHSSTGSVKINVENADWRWSSISDINRENNYTNIFLNKNKVLSEIERCVDNGKHNKQV